MTCDSTIINYYGRQEYENNMELIMIAACSILTKSLNRPC